MMRRQKECGISKKNHKKIEKHGKKWKWWKIVMRMRVKLLGHTHTHPHLILS